MVARITDNRRLILYVKGEERYSFLWDTEQQPEVLRQFGRFASNPDLSFTWYDAAVCSQKVRERATA